MTRILILLAMFLTLATQPIDILAASGTITVPLTPPAGESDTNHDNRGEYRRRTPPPPVMLTVDFDTKLITLTNGIDPAEITAYEIRDTAGQPLYVFSDDTSFVTTLSTLPPEEYQILLTLPSSSLIGYIHLI